MIATEELTYLELLELMRDMSARCDDSEEFVALIAPFLEDQGLSPIEICTMFLEFGREVGHVDGHLCVLSQQQGDQVKIGTGGYL